MESLGSLDNKSLPRTQLIYICRNRGRKWQLKTRSCNLQFSVELVAILVGTVAIFHFYLQLLQPHLQLKRLRRPRLQMRLQKLQTVANRIFEFFFMKRYF